MLSAQTLEVKSGATKPHPLGRLHCKLISGITGQTLSMTDAHSEDSLSLSAGTLKGVRTGPRHRSHALTLDPSKALV